MGRTPGIPPAPISILSGTRLQTDKAGIYTLRIVGHPFDKDDFLMTAPSRSMSRLGLLLAFGLAWFSPAFAHASGWLESFPEATARATREGKPILVQFTGSDWCHWCRVLDAEVFNTPHFKNWAQERVVLLLLDFPRRKKLPPALQAQNRALVQHYGVQGYPTVLFLTPDGTKIGESGYRKGGPRNWIAEAESILDTAPVIRPQIQTPPLATAPHTATPDHTLQAPAAAAANTLAQRTAHARANSAAVQTRLRPDPEAAGIIPPAATTVPPTRLQESYIRAEAIAFRHRIPLLVVLYPQGGERGHGAHIVKEMDTILSHPSVAQASQQHLAVVRLSLPLQGTDRVIWNSVSRQHGIGDTAVALLDPDGKLLHLEHAGRIRADSFLRGIQPYIPAAPITRESIRPQTPTQDRATRTPAAIPVYEGGWLEDFEQARATAHALNRPMLVDFTGSDWCGWCVRLTEEIFSTPEFMAYARNRYVLVKLDYPRFKEQSAALQQQNAALAQHYDIQSFPTVLLMHADGTPQQRLGYVSGGPQAFFHRLESVSAMR